MKPETDVVVVGAGACGSLVAHKLAARGFSVVVLEAGKRFDPARDLPNTETNAAKIMWTERAFSAAATRWRPRPASASGAARYRGWA
jgi:choline dehydrogenase-like flavoprotein